MPRYNLLLAPLALAACATTSEPEIAGCYEGPCIGIGESQEFGIMTVTPLEVLEDSRCPIEAECVWAGRLRLKTRLDIGHETIEAEIDGYQAFRINGGMLTLAEIAPDPSVKWPKLRQEDYGFRFTFAPDVMAQATEPR